MDGHNNLINITKIELCLVGGMLGLTVISGAVASSIRVNADDNDTTVSTASVTVQASCSMTATIDTAHTANIPNGIYSGTSLYPNGIGKTTIATFCNDNSGYAIYAIGYSGDQYSGADHTKLLGTGGEKIATGTATSGDTSNWAMKLTKVTDATESYNPQNLSITNGYDSFSAVPDTYTKVANYTSTTDQTLGSVLSTTYAAYISPTQVADTYTGKVKYTLVHPNTTPAPVACNPDATTIAEALCMQDFAGANHDAIVASMTAGTQYTKKDKRDGKSYTIAKYQTGTDSSTSQPIYDVWMTQNLDLDLDASKTYTNEDTDIGYNTSTGTYGTASWSPMRSTYTATANQIHEWCNGGTWNSGGYCEENDTPESYDPGNLYWNSTESNSSDWYAYYDSCDFSTSTPTCNNQSLNPLSTYTGSTGTAQYHLGNYYNWAAALATNDSSVYGNNDLVEQSICPAGWTLPRIGTGEDTFYALWNQYSFANDSYNDSNSNGQHDSNENALWTSPLYFSAGGYFNGVLYDVGYDGGFWSPVADGSSNARGAYFVVGGDSYPSGDGNRGVGYSVRCVARPVAGS